HSVELRQFLHEVFPWALLPGGSVSVRGGRPEFPANRATKLHRVYREDVPWGEFPGGSVRRALGSPELAVNPNTRVYLFYREHYYDSFPSVLEGWKARSGVRFPPFVTYTQVLEQFSRVADGSLVRYELYAGEGEEPDFSASGQP